MDGAEVARFGRAVGRDLVSIGGARVVATGGSAFPRKAAELNGLQINTGM
jgi:hypothetical protein